MAIELTKQQSQEAVASLRRYFDQELEQELSEMRAKFLLEYFLKEIAPLAYNQGVKDAESYFRTNIEDLPAVCFEEEMTFWKQKRK